MQPSHQLGVRAAAPDWFVPGLIAGFLVLGPLAFGLFLWLQKWRKGQLTLDERTLGIALPNDLARYRLVDLVGAAVSSAGRSVTIDLELRDGAVMVGPLVVSAEEERELRAFFTEVNRRIDAYAERRGKRTDIPRSLEDLR